MKKIYIVLTHTGTMLSKIIRFYTKNEFSHVSISLDSELKQMYSFGRLKPTNAFIGGFVHEYINSGTFKRFKNTVTKVYELNIEDEQYEKIKNMIMDIERHKDNYKFNVLGLFLVALKIKFKTKNSFYCAEFVKYVLQENGVEKNLPRIIRPEDFKSIKNKELVYSGFLRNYRYVSCIEQVECVS